MLFWTPHFSVLDSTFFVLDSTFWLDSKLKIDPASNRFVVFFLWCFSLGVVNGVVMRCKNGHPFCMECIQEWIRRRRSVGHYSVTMSWTNAQNVQSFLAIDVCPVCRVFGLFRHDAATDAAQVSNCFHRKSQSVYFIHN